MKSGGRGKGAGDGRGAEKKNSTSADTKGSGRAGDKKDKLNGNGIINLTEYIEEARGERVSRLKSDVERGSYSVEAEKVAEKIIERAARAARGAVRSRGTKKSGK